MDLNSFYSQPIFGTESAFIFDTNFSFLKNPVCFWYIWVEKSVCKPKGSPFGFFSTLKIFHKRGLASVLWFLFRKEAEMIWSFRVSSKNKIKNAFWATLGPPLGFLVLCNLLKRASWTLQSTFALLEPQSRHRLMLFQAFMALFRKEKQWGFLGTNSWNKTQRVKVSVFRPFWSFTLTFSMFLWEWVKSSTSKTSTWNTFFMVIWFFGKD